MRNEKNVKLIGIDDLQGVPLNVRKELKKIKDDPLKGEVMRIFNKNMKIIKEGLINESITIIE